MEIERRLVEFKGVVLSDDGGPGPHDHTRAFGGTTTTGTVKAAGTKHGSFAGYGSVFGNLDSYGDVILPGAFKGTLPQFIAEGFLAWGHEWGGQPIATVKAAREDDQGLWIEGEFHSTDYAQECRAIARERVERGKRMGLSIGFRTKPGGAEWSEDGNFRVLKDLELFEVSLVLMPANPKAMVSSVKSFQDHADAVLEAADGLIRRSRALADLRAKDGRQISAESRAKLASLYEQLGELVSVPAGQGQDDDQEARRKAAQVAHAEYLRTQARLLGVA